MQIEFKNCTITAVSKPYVYENPQSMDSKSIFNITICQTEIVNAEGQAANVCYGLSYSLPGVQTDCGFKRGDIVDIDATMRGRWNDRFFRTENEMYVERIGHSK